MRTTLDIDPLILEELRARAKAEGKTMGALASALLARALSAPPASAEAPLTWHAQDLGATIDMSDWSAAKDWLEREDNEPYVRR